MSKRSNDTKIETNTAIEYKKVNKFRNLSNDFQINEENFE